VFPAEPPSSVVIRGGAGEQLAVVRDVQDGLGRLGDPCFEPPLARDVEIVVRFVEDQHVVRASEQGLQDEPFLLTTGQRHHVAPLREVKGLADALRAADVPEHFGVVTADVGPVSQRGGVGELCSFVVAVHKCQFGLVQDCRSLLDPQRRHRDQQIPHRRDTSPGADELAHHADRTLTHHRPAVRRDIAGKDAQQGRLAAPVCSDERHLGSLADAKGDLVQEGSAVG
jgi:hypothetical protein